MAISLFGSFRTASLNGVAGTTIFWTIGNDGMGLGSVPVTESVSQIPFRTAGKFAKLTCLVTNNDRSASTMTSRVNGGAGTLSVSITGSTTGAFSDLTHIDSVSGNGDLWNLSLVYGTGGTVTAVTGKSIQFTPNINSQTLSKYDYSNPNGTSNVTAASTTYFFQPTGVGTTGITSEANIPIPVRINGTLSKLSAHASVNASTSAVTVVSRKNSSAGTLSLSITALTTGLFEDTSNTQPMLSGDTFNYAATSGTGTAATTIDFIASEFITANGYQQVMSGGPATAINANLTRFIGMGGLGAATVETSGQNIVYSPFFVSKLSLGISVNTLTATSTGTFRVANQSGVNVVSIGSGATGTFSDSTPTHIDKPVATNAVDFQLVTGTTGSSITVAQVSYLMQNIPGGLFYGAGV